MSEPEHPVGAPSAPEGGGALSPRCQALRKDAERNRERILAAARRCFAEEGLDVSMNAIAKAADVGIATLYRRFPTRESLIGEAFADRMDAYVRAIGQALDDPDPWRGFRWYVEEVCAMQAADRGFGRLLTVALPTVAEFEAARAEALRGFTELVARAQAAGGLRRDFVPEDLALLQMANAGVLSAMDEADPGAWRRLVAVHLAAFASDRADVPFPPAPCASVLRRAMLRLRRGCPSPGRGGAAE